MCKLIYKTADVYCGPVELVPTQTDQSKRLDKVRGYRSGDFYPIDRCSSPRSKLEISVAYLFEEADVYCSPGRAGSDPGGPT